MDNQTKRNILSGILELLQTKRNEFQSKKEEVKRLNDEIDTLASDISGLDKTAKTLQRELGISDEEIESEAKADVNKTDMVLTLVKGAKNKGISIQEVAAGLRSLGVEVADSYVRTILSRLVERGLITRIVSHYYAPSSEQEEFMEELKKA